jgi:hypothetical protein
MGIGPFDCKLGDMVVIFPVGNFGFMLRPNVDTYHLLGVAYIQGLMNGEAIRTDENGQIVGLQDFILC